MFAPIFPGTSAGSLATVCEPVCEPVCAPVVAPPPATLPEPPPPAGAEEFSSISRKRSRFAFSNCLSRISNLFSNELKRLAMRSLKRPAMSSCKVSIFWRSCAMPSTSSSSLAVNCFCIVTCVSSSSRCAASWASNFSTRSISSPA